MKYILPCDFQNVDYSCADKNRSRVKICEFLNDITEL